MKVENVSHLCELQIHLMPIKESEPLHKSHTVYEFFRSFFWAIQTLSSSGWTCCARCPSTRRRCW